MRRAEASFPEALARIWGDADPAACVDAVECVGFDATVRAGAREAPVRAEARAGGSVELRVRGLATPRDAKTSSYSHCPMLGPGV